MFHLQKAKAMHVEVILDMISDYISKFFNLYFFLTVVLQTAKIVVLTRDPSVLPSGEKRSLNIHNSLVHC